MQMPAGKFKSGCLALMDRVNKTHEEIVITKHGKPIARMVPVSNAPKIPLFGCMKGTVHAQGDLLESLDIDWGEHAN